MWYLSSPESRIEVQMSNKPSVEVSVLAFIRNLYLKIPQKRRHQFVQLQQGYVLPNTSSSTGTKLEHRRFHLS